MLDHANRPLTPNTLLSFVFSLSLCGLLFGSSTVQAADPKAACGAAHCVALHSDGTVWAWGKNKEGQLGDGSQTKQPVPVRIEGLRDVADVAAGYDHSLAVKTDGTVWAWGKNEMGQLGDGSTANRSSPVQVSGLSGIAAVAAGGAHSLALGEDFRVWAWGNNFDGQAGTGTDGNQYTTPRPVSGLAGVIGIAAGENHSLAVQSGGALFAWGLNVASQLGDGTDVSRSEPIDTGLRDVVSTAAGSSHSLAVLGDGSVWAWGHSRFGQVGIGEIGDILKTPTRLTGLDNAALVAAGKHHSLALLNSGKVWAWGQNLNGQLGDGSQANRAAPVPIVVVDTVVMPVGGEKHTTVIKTDGRVWAWGDNTAGQLGAPNSDLSEPARIASLEGVESVEAGADFTLAIQDDGSLWSWGNNEAGQLGDGETVTRNIPYQSDLLSDVKEVAAGNKHAVALLKDGTLWAWGGNDKGQLGDGTMADRPAPAQVPDITDVKTVTAGYGHTVVLKEDGTVWAWGQNDFGQLGDGSIEDRSTPQPVNGLAGVVALATGHYHSIALLSDGVLKAWGQNNFGQLGDATDDSQGDSRLEPVTVVDSSGNPVPEDMIQPGEEEVIDGKTVTGPDQIGIIAAGASHSMALRPDGAAWVWGYNNVGQLGLGDIATRMNPEENPDLAATEAITTHSYHSLAIDSAGALLAWGNNEFGQLGEGGVASKTKPVSVVELAGITDIATGSGHSLAVKDDGTIWAWGANAKGQLGNGQIAKVAGLELLHTGALTIKNLAFEDGESAIYESDESLTTEGAVLIKPGAEVKFIAPLITLGPGFHALPGSSFFAGSQNPDAAQARLRRRPWHLAVSPAPDPAIIDPAIPAVPSGGHKSKGSGRTNRNLKVEAMLARFLKALGAEGSGFQSDRSGRKLVFSTPASLVATDQNAADDVYLYSAEDDRLQLISATLEGDAGNGPSAQPAIDAAGERVAFASAANNLGTDADLNQVADIYLHHLATGVTQRVSPPSPPGRPLESLRPEFRDAGRIIAYRQHPKDPAAPCRLALQDLQTAAVAYAECPQPTHPHPPTQAERFR